MRHCHRCRGTAVRIPEPACRRGKSVAVPPELFPYVLSPRSLTSRTFSSDVCIGRFTNRVYVFIRKRNAVVYPCQPHVSISRRVERGTSREKVVPSPATLLKDRLP